MNSHVRDKFIDLGQAKSLVVALGDPGGAVLTVGVKAYIEVPFGIRITGWSLTADQSGSLVLDVWKDTWANFPPTIADTITGTETPTLSSAQKAQDLSLTTWNPDLAQGDVIALYVASCSAIKQATLTMRASLLSML